METLFEMNIEDREKWFRGVVVLRNKSMLMDKKALEDFMDYWTQEKTWNKRGFKKNPVMLWEVRREESAFDIGKRMAYWKRANPASNGSTINDPSDLDAIKDPIKLMAAKQQLRQQGWRYKEVKVNTGTIRKWTR